MAKTRREGFQGQRKVEATGYFTTALRQQGSALRQRFGNFPALAMLGLVDPRQLPGLPGIGYRGHYDLVATQYGSLA